MLEESFKEIRTLEMVKEFDGVVLFGAGASCESMITALMQNGIKILGLFDNDNKKWGKILHSCEIQPPSLLNQINHHIAIMISSVKNQYEIALDLTSNYHFLPGQLFTYTSLFSEKYLYDVNKIEFYSSEIEKTLSILGDEASKEMYQNCLAFRRNRNPLLAQNNPCIIERYGYDNGCVRIAPEKGDTILDCGAYTGDTADYFCHQLENQCQIHCIEAFSSNFEMLQHNLKKQISDGVVQCYHFAIGQAWNSTVIINAPSEISVAATLELDTQNTVIEKTPLDSLDHVFLDKEMKVDFIKMDIEGAEMDALAGARGILSRDRPRMVLSAYHRLEHLWEIPRLVKEIIPDCQIFFGHQPDAPFEPEFYVGYGK